MSWAADNQSFYDAAGKTLAEKPIFMRTVSGGPHAAQQKLFDRIAPKLTSPSSFWFALHCYDSVMLLAPAIKQANSDRRSEDPRGARKPARHRTRACMKTYDKPFSQDRATKR